MPRAIWKGAISFGLVHIPVSLVSATSAQGVDFDWLDKRSMDPVGYKRINKTTGKEVTKDNIVKGVAYEKGRYVVLSEDEIRAAHPKATQTIEIIAFIDSDQVPLQNIDTPYYLAPDKRGGKVFIDYPRNGRGASTVAAYSVRARPGLPVSVPISRQELASLRSAQQWNVANLEERLHGLKADPWAGYANRQRISKKMWQKLGAQPPAP
ncbi:Ku protein [Pseudomonas proteolytica]|uniref:non-homologous end-joining DNA ligase LigD n=1 Tax=Pseudomonas proteolytica TaxID=219574 RepID=UPI00089B3C79|nr:Ku protein [Pseudomonas proteolytica]SEE30028.1 Ku protein [Pseudomonas proteolytica]